MIFRNGKKRKTEIEISDEEWIDESVGLIIIILNQINLRAQYMVIDKRTSHNGDVLLDGDSAFAASAVSDLRHVLVQY